MAGKPWWPHVSFSLVLTLAIASFHHLPLAHLPTSRQLVSSLCSHSMRVAIRTASERRRSPATLEHRQPAFVLSRLAACAPQAGHLAPPEVGVLLMGSSTSGLHSNRRTHGELRFGGLHFQFSCVQGLERDSRTQHDSGESLVSYVYVCVEMKVQQ